VIFRSARCRVDGCPGPRLVRFIQAATSSIDCSIYDFRYVHALAAMRAAVRRGCRVRIAFDAGTQAATPQGADPKPPTTVDALREHGLLQYARSIRRTSNSYLHHKFMIRDGSAVWTGTGNFTEGAFALQDNNFLIARSVLLARRYQEDFNVVWSMPTSDPLVPQALSAARMADSRGILVRPFFEPKAGLRIEDAIARALTRASKVRVMAFEMSDPVIMTALERFAGAEADIRGIYDINGMKGAVARVKPLDPKLYWWYLGDARFVGVKSHPFGVLNNGLNDFHHNKTMILDDHLVITGSYNFSKHAETNNEDMLFIRSRAVAAAYTRYFRRMFQHYVASGGQ